MGKSHQESTADRRNFGILLQRIKEILSRLSNTHEEVYGDGIIRVIHVRISCEKGRHRSVMVAEWIADWIRKQGGTCLILYWHLHPHCVSKKEPNRRFDGACGCHIRDGQFLPINTSARYMGYVRGVQKERKGMRDGECGNPLGYLG